MIIETCQKCGHDLMNTVICTYPPTPQKTCPSCGWSWTGKAEEIQRVPFGGNSYQETPDYLNSYPNLNFQVDNVDTVAEVATKEEALKHFRTQNKRYIREHDGRPCKYYLAALNALKNWQEEVDINYLYNWYIDSVDNTQEPVWTAKHIEELFNDFILIPKNEV